MTMLDQINSPADLRKLPVEQLPEVAREIRESIVAQVSRTGGHLAPNLGVVDLTIALHRLRFCARPAALRRRPPVLSAQAADRASPPAEQAPQA
jgi:transketolase N-terminal domain/subunit